MFCKARSIKEKYDEEEKAAQAALKVAIAARTEAIIAANPAVIVESFQGTVNPKVRGEGQLVPEHEH